jgi:NADP-dependent 3-hydroxy acid dehydrogenase YdfG
MKVIISGASRGIGQQMVRYFLLKKYKVIAIARTYKIKDDFFNPLFEFHSIDFEDIEIAESKIKLIYQLHQDVNIIINNVGMYKEEEMHKMQTSSLTKMLNCNLQSAILLTQPYLQQFKSLNNGIIIHIGSTLSTQVLTQAASYTISKHALRAYHELLIDFFKNSQVKVTLINPGFINTSSWDGIEAEKETFIQEEDMIRAIDFILQNPEYININELNIKPVIYK